MGDVLVARSSATRVDDVAWSYEDPLPESILIRGLLSFDNQHAAVVAELPIG